MNAQMLEVHPRELKLKCEVKKQSSCAVHLTNLTDQYVAFKVKTTSPKKYCVKPNMGIIKPKATCDFIILMQAQKASSHESKDKFLVQATVVPYGTSEDKITSGMFSKESQKYVEETKLRVVLTSRQNSPVVAPEEVVFHENDSSPISGGVIKQDSSHETLKSEDTLQNGVENLPPKMVKKVEDPEKVEITEDVLTKEVQKPQQINDAEEMKKDMISKIAAMESKLVEAGEAISKIKEDIVKTLHDNKNLKQELETLSARKTTVRKVRIGFPPLLVFMVALICLMIGYSLRS